MIIGIEEVNNWNEYWMREEADSGMTNKQSDKLVKK